jgi:hypothetical protein
MKPSEPRLTIQMNLPLCKSEPMLLPEEKQQELALALADLLLQASLIERTQTDEGDRR